MNTATAGRERKATYSQKVYGEEGCLWARFDNSPLRVIAMLLYVA